MLNKTLYICMALAAAALASCSSDDDTPATTEGAGENVIRIDARHPAATRATASAFEEGDRIGLFVADAQTPLELSGNLVNNEEVTLRAGTWTTERRLYWDDGTYNAYAYYPYMDVKSVDDQPFSVATDQTTPRNGNAPGGYEASDLLFACTTDVTASTSPITLRFRHIMSRLTVRLVKGEDFEGEMPTDAQVFVHNTVPAATIDLDAGIATRETKGGRHTIRARQESDYMFAAIVIPQRFDNRMPLVEVVMKGVSYLVESKFLFKAGTNHLVNVIISDNPEQVKIEVGGEKGDWQ